MNLISQKREIIQICERMYKKSLVASHDGNVSVRLDKKRILVTPAGKSKGFLKPQDMVIVNYQGKKLEGKLSPTSELPMHLFIYQKREDVQAVVHAHPPFATAFSLANISLKKNILPEMILSVGAVPTAPYATPSTSEVPESLKPFIDDFSAVIMKNHGVVAWGKELEEAYQKLETVEHFAKIYFLAMTLGKADELTQADVEKLNKIKKN
jgi:L-fuculose-phosphate aldolase